MSQIIPIRDLKNTAEICEKCKNTDEPIYITKNGYGEMVLMNIDVYNRMFAMVDIYNKLKEAEDDIENGGEFVDGRKFLQGIKNKHAKI